MKLCQKALLLAVAMQLFRASATAAAEMTDTRESRCAVVQGVRLDEVYWTNGFWADRFKTVREHSLPAMWEIMKGTRYKPFYQHFLIAAGNAEGEYRGAAWNDGDFYKFLEAVCATFAVTRDPALLEILDQSIEVIGAAQRQDGYIYTPVLIRQRHGDETARPFEDRHNFEMYCMGHLITAACLHHRVTGSEKFLNIARRTADFLWDTFREPTLELARNSVCPSHYMAMVELYRTTREPRYLQLAQKFLDMRNMVRDGGDDNQDRIPFLQQREAVGHAVRANYLYAGAADLFLETGDAKLWAPLDAIWQNVTKKKMYITGGCGALYDGASPDGSEEQQQITRVHQAYGRSYQLPNVTAHNETCAAIGNVLWNWRMFLATGEARYVDIQEIALYNAVLSGISLGGTDYFYVNPLRHLEPLPTKLRWPRERVPFMTSFCCPPNVLRTIAQVNAYAYSKSANAVWVNLYGGSVLSSDIGNQPLRLAQETDYPWDGRVRIMIEECPGSEFALMLRIPGWAESAQLSVNNTAVPMKLTLSSYAEVRRTWKPGDVIELVLPMPARMIEAHPLVEETRGQVAIMRGPLVYCLESTDLPGWGRVHDVVLPANTTLRAKYDPQLLQGVTVVEADAIVQRSANWNGELYRPLHRGLEERVNIKLIPYYAWGNRGPVEMTVWLPVR